MVLNNVTIADVLEIQNSCSVKLNGKMFYLGGGTDKNQGTELVATSMLVTDVGDEMCW